MTVSATCLDQHLDAIHAQPDPFGYASRWYESRKRDLLLATLPRKQFRHGWEMGCSNGELTAALATRCERLLATDLSANAVRQARSRTNQLPNVEVFQARQPDQWPDGQYDLIVMSEVGYYLDNDELSATVQSLSRSLTNDGVLVACHWLSNFKQARQPGRQVHQRLAQWLHLPLIYRYEDADFLLEAWSAVTESVGQREGLR